VSDQTQDGETGAMVTYVYPHSPAAKAGIEPGFILLRLRLADRPNPQEVKLDDDRMYQQAFPWDQLDQVPDRYFERIPTPWPPAENNFTRLLTDAGFGTKYNVEFFANGQTIKKDLEVVPSPPHYDSAARYKSEPLGITVRNLTFEVRRYFQKKDDEPGVIISKIEPGSKVAVAGIKPYEIITHINGQVVATVQDFEKLASNQEELNLAIKRMTKGRLVKVRMSITPEIAGPAKKPDESSEPAATTKSPLKKSDAQK
jgi:S1-C subfamily serine protease